MKGAWLFPDAVRRDSAIEAWFKNQAPELGAMARSWFERMRECGTDVREVMHDGCPTACAEDAAFCYVNVFRAHANVGFFYGSELADPAGLLEGDGRRMRHVKLKPGVAVNTAGLDTLIRTAYADARLRLAATEADGRQSADERKARRRPTKG